MYDRLRYRRGSEKKWRLSTTLQRKTKFAGMKRLTLIARRLEGTAGSAGVSLNSILPSATLITKRSIIVSYRQQPCKTGAMDLLLHPIEVRVLGSLLEKEITTPEYYPLSLNALINACNQKSNREPMVSYDDEIVDQALGLLREKRL